MGCTLATPPPGLVDNRELAQILSPEDIKVVQETWLYLQDDMSRMGLEIFKRFFAQNGDLKRLFYKKLHCSGVTLENVAHIPFDERKLMSHGLVVMEALGAAVECLHDSDQLSLLLIGVGERHVLYGVQREMIPRLWPAIVSVIEEYLGEHFSSKAGRSWERVFQYIGSRVIEGIERWHKNMDVEKQLEPDQH
ncbi:globin, polymeric component P2-like [Mya arenaria]|nr:globin, polymeric component P2-like [Mya arenaria]